MQSSQQAKAIIVRSQTKMEELKKRFNTMSQASFYIKRQRENIKSKKSFLSSKIQASIASNKEALLDQVGSGEMSDFEDAHDRYHAVIQEVSRKSSQILKTVTIESEHVPSYMFGPQDIILVIGRDGLVANVAKYVTQNPILAINPDVTRFDGVLLPFEPENFQPYLQKVVLRKYTARHVTLGEVMLDDGQRLLAFNDFFIGTESHTSARYQITHQGLTENHSSSGIIISTGAGSTGWLSSLFNMANCIQATFGQAHITQGFVQDWASRQLVFIVREPFLSKTSQIKVGAGIVQEGNELVIESLMPQNGVIFSDGVLADRIQFNSGSIARIGLAPERAELVIPD